MSSVLMTVLLAAAPAPTLPAVAASLDDVAAAVREEARTGTLLFSRGDCLAVKVFGGGPYTHVAAVVVRDGEPFVYDSANGAGVRRLPLTSYIETQRPDALTVMQPRQPFEGAREESFRRHLDEQLDRPYGVKHHLTGKRAEGIHCAEYVTDALCEARLVHAERPPRVSPASLAEGILNGDVYAISTTFEVLPASEPVEEEGSWCGRTWSDTKTCTTRCCRQMSRWFLCR
ncbi:MAG: hypothetical protein WD066_04435 [Planctomycetaceae bacterium]